MPMYYVYVLKSLKDSKHYIGLTNSVERRLKEHNAGKVSSTKDRIPFVLIYQETFEKKKDAEKRERYFKTGKGRQTLKICIQSCPPKNVAGSPPPN